MLRHMRPISARAAKALGKALFPALVLAGCALTPQQKCEAPLRRALADNAALIEQTGRNLKTGHIYVPARNSIGALYCPDDRGRYHLCINPEPGRPAYRRLRIDPAAEEARLKALLARREALTAQIARCEGETPPAAPTP